MHTYTNAYNRDNNAQHRIYACSWKLKQTTLKQKPFKQKQKKKQTRTRTLKRSSKTTAPPVRPPSLYFIRISLFAKCIHVYTHTHTHVSSITHMFVGIIYTHGHRYRHRTQIHTIRVVRFQAATTKTFSHSSCKASKPLPRNVIEIDFRVRLGYHW